MMGTKVLCIIAMVALIVGGCSSHLPKYPRGTLVTHISSGMKGQVIEWWCRNKGACEYQVRFGLQGGSIRGGGFAIADSGGGFGSSRVEPAAFANEILMGWELDPTDQKQWMRLLEEQRQKHPKKDNPVIDYRRRNQ